MEARAHRRYRVWLPIRVSSDTVEAAVAVSKDASAGGLLMSATDALEPGARVDLAFAVPNENGDAAEQHEISGTITRVEPNQDDPTGPWPWRVAVKFDAPLAIDGALAAIEDELRKSK